MRDHVMKMVWIMYSEGIESELQEMLKATSIEGYTKWTKVLGKGRTGGPHLSTSVWPRANNVLALCVDDKQARKLLDEVKKLRATVGKEGVKAFMMNVEEFT